MRYHPYPGERAITQAIMRLSRWLPLLQRGRDRSAGLRVTPAADPKPRVPAKYLPLYTYLERRFATTVVLTFEQIESLLGFAPPPPAFADQEWWTGPVVGGDRHSDAWTVARRTAMPNFAARVVAFERQP